MAVDECGKDNPQKPCTQEGMLRRIPPKNMGGAQALPVGLHVFFHGFQRIWSREHRAEGIGLSPHPCPLPSACLPVGRGRGKND
jgi:hypothetical protein